MLKKFAVKNYKNFKDKIEINFDKVGGYQFCNDCISNHLISKMIIYGRNATGKTNFGKALFDICNNMSMLWSIKSGLYINADSSDKLAEFEYEFIFDADELKYRYRKYSEVEIYDEELLLNGIEIFYYNFESKESRFDNLNLLDAETIKIERYLEAMETHENDESIENNASFLPFLRWLINNTALSSESVLLKLADFIRRMAMVSAGYALMRQSSLLYENFYKTLEDEENLKDFQEFLNVMGIECELVTDKSQDGKNQLFFKHETPIPFMENASSGTKALVNLYRRFEIGRKASLLYIDEFDAFYHYEMAENLIKFFKEKYSECQIILTTHNTNLMTNRLSRPDCLFILSRDGKLTALCDATPRELREGHNLEKMYISGEFDKYE